MTEFTLDPVIDSVLLRLYDEDHAQRAAGLPSSQRTRNIDIASGRFLSLIARTMHARVFVEIGSSNGVSTIWLASAMWTTGGFVTGSEIIPARAAEANANLAAAGLAAFAKVSAGDARDIVAANAGPIDLVFIDAEKEDYIAHFEVVEPLVRPGGLILADNVTSHDLGDYQAIVRERPDLDTVTLTLDRGIEMTVKRGD